MSNLLHRPALRRRLRALRPYYNVLFRRRRNYDRRPPPQEYLARMKGRGVFLLCFGRSGSTVFADYLGSHPQVLSFGEVLGEESYYSYFQWLTRGVLWFWPLRPTLLAQEFYRYCAQLVLRKPGKRCLFDIKIESLHLIDGNWRMPGPEFQLLLHLRAANVPVILLTRRDLVGRYVSGQVAERRGAYHSYHHAGSDVAPFAADIAAIKSQVTQIEATYAHIRQIFDGHEAFLDMAYEDMFATDPLTGATRFAPSLGQNLAALLGVADAFDPRPKLQKLSDDRGYADLLTNANEVDAFRAQVLAS